jgi:hypothetical protein
VDGDQCRARLHQLLAQLNALFERVQQADFHEQRDAQVAAECLHHAQHERAVLWVQEIGAEVSAVRHALGAAEVQVWCKGKKKEKVKSGR